MQLSLKDIEDFVKQGSKSWIYQLNKEGLKKVCDNYYIDCSDTDTVEGLRALLSNYVEVKVEELKKFEVNTSSENKTSVLNKNTTKTMATNSTLKSYKKGENWRAYSTQLKCFITLNDIEPQKQEALLITKLSTDMFEILTSLCAPDSSDNEKFNFEQLVKKLEDHFHVDSKHAKRFEFKNRKQTANESIKEYVTALKTIAQKCEFNDLDDRVKEQLTEGIRSKAICFEILKNSEKTMEEIVKLAMQVELAEKQAYGMNVGKEKQEEQDVFSVAYSNRGHPRNYRGKQRGTQGQRHPAAGYQRKQQASTSEGCYCCGNMNHFARECTLRNKFCSECGKKGHIYKMCRNKQGMGNLSRINNVNSIFDNNNESENLSENNLSIELDEMVESTEKEFKFII